MKKVFFMITALGLVYLIVSSINTDLFSFRATQTVTEQRDMNPHEKSSNGETDKFASAALVDNKELETKALENKNREANDQGEQAQAHKLSDLRRSDIGFGESGLSESENANQALELEFNKLSKAHASLQEEFALLRASLSKIQATKQDTAHITIAENNHSLGSQQTSMQHSSSYPSNSHPSNSQQSAAATLEQDQEGLKNTSYDSEQKRRLQQQAVLRDLAQKRQLAAIQALQTSSAR